MGPVPLNGPLRPPRLVRVDHVQLAMPAGDAALTAAQRWYGEVLGLVRVDKPAALAVRGGAWFEAPGGGVAIHLGVEEPFRPARKAHPALVVDGYDDLCARITAAGGAVRPDDSVPGIRRCHTDDPFGNRIELIDATA